MSWRNVLVSNPARLSLKNASLLVKQEEEILVPLEDISTIVVESEQATITSKLLDEIARRGIALYICDPKHMPSGLFLSFQQHSRFVKTLKTQINVTEAFRKNCWRLIVQGKIMNQAKCLDIIGMPGSEDLKQIGANVKSGDSSNRESVAARLYFEIYMPYANRQTDDRINAALNYGYSIIRGAVARSLTSYGFLPALGLHHRSELNSFNLADDFMEPLRPLVDLWVAQNIHDDGALDKKDRVGLLSLLQADMAISGERQATARAIDIMAASFSTACASTRPGKLKLPELIPISAHSYE